MNKKDRLANEKAKIFKVLDAVESEGILMQVKSCLDELVQLEHIGDS